MNIFATNLDPQVCAIEHCETSLCLPIDIAQKNNYDVEESYKDYLNGKYIEWLQRDNPIIPTWQIEKPSWISPVANAMLKMTKK